MNVANSPRLGRVPARLSQALEFMRQAHAGETRKHGAPYATHPEAVMNILALEYQGIPVSENTLIIALLHDVLENTHITQEGIASLFGSTVAAGVRLLTRIPKEPFAGYAERLKAAPVEILLVKAADRLHNLRESTLTNDPQFPLSYCRETRQYLLPLFSAEPLAWFRKELESMCQTIETSGKKL